MPYFNSAAMENDSQCGGGDHHFRGLKLAPDYCSVLRWCFSIEERDNLREELSSAYGSKIDAVYYEIELLRLNEVSERKYLNDFRNQNTNGCRII